MLPPRFRWPFLLAACCIALGALMQVPQALRMMSPEYRGILVHLNSDEEIYQARVEEALQGRPEQAAEALVGDPRLRGSQSAQLEALEGTAFRFAGWSAPVLLQVLDSIIPPLLFLLLWWFFLSSGFTRRQALLGAAFFCLLELYNLNRPVYQRTSTLAVLLVFLLLMQGLDRRRPAGVLGGMLLGWLTGGYFWGWTFGWIWTGVLFLWELIDWSRLPKHERSTAVQSRWMRLLLFLLVAAVSALPALLALRHLASDPLYPLAVFRSGIHPSHLPESWPYTVLFAVMTAGVATAFLHHREELRRRRYACVMVLAAFVAINQQMIHGIVFNFVSHYLFFLIIAAIGMLLLAFSLRFRPRILALSAAAACIYLAAIGFDGRFILKQWHPRPSDFVDQRLATLLPILNSLPRTRLLTDSATALFVADETKHDVVYALYLKNVLLSDRELAERFCMTQLPEPPEKRMWAQQTQLLWPDADAAFRNDPSVRRRELHLVSDACARLDRDPVQALKTYGVSSILWNEQRTPDWNLARLRVPLTKIGQGEGWSLWKL
ncbi:hypothetical protein HY285_03740 [Candidatus Peregrinibacteria bacterium]|nr:hypothetical protein [Candidatus Peregrinibacteria bacterium]MBI3816628.1 hypothetical protein [Candidatus Peregrinibacteria bacterium]